MDGKLFLNILASALNSVPFDASPYSDQQWQKAFELSQIHKLLPLFTDASTPCCPLEKERLSPYIRQSKLMITQQVMNSADFLELCKALQKENIPFVTVKGIICRSTYKKPDLRVSGDEDLLVFGENFEKAGENVIGYSAMIILMLSSISGTYVAQAVVKRRRQIVCAAASSAYFLSLLAINALFFGGQYQGIGATALVIAAGAGVMILMGLKGSTGHDKRIKKYGYG